MGLFSNLGLGDTLSGVLGSLQSAAMPALINAVLEKTQYNDINGLVAALQKGGLGPQVQSWLGTGRQHSDHRGSAQGDSRQFAGSGLRAAVSACRSTRP